MGLSQAKFFCLCHAGTPTPVSRSLVWHTGAVGLLSCTPPSCCPPGPSGAAGHPSFRRRSGSRPRPSLPPVQSGPPQGVPQFGVTSSLAAVCTAVVQTHTHTHTHKWKRIYDFGQCLATHPFSSFQETLHQQGYCRPFLNTFDLFDCSETFCGHFRPVWAILRPFQSSFYQTESFSLMTLQPKIFLRTLHIGKYIAMQLLLALQSVQATRNGVLPMV